MITKVSNSCIDMIKYFESSNKCDLKSYKCPAGVWTIGWGTTSADRKITGCNIVEGMTITEETANKWLEDSLNQKYAPLVSKYNSRYNWNQNQFDALVSFAYNVGSIDGLTAKGTRTIEEISDKLLSYNKACGKELKGLTTRRQKEKELFDKAIVKTAIVKAVNKEKTSSSTKKASSSASSTVKKLQQSLNSSYGLSLEIDGIIGSKTINVLKKYSLKQGSKNAYVKWVQTQLKSKGYNINIDGVMGTKTIKILKKFQASNKLTVDGVCGYNTVNKLL